jgi:glycerol-1-phosphate dehydrogenase [NAD(P)+]
MAFCKQIIKESINADSILAVGTGSVNDLCRYASFLSNKPYSVFATAPSMDGFASCVSPLIENGFKRTYTAISPLAVIADSDILARSPHELKAAGFGDIIGKYTALADWKIAHLLTGEYYCDGICRLVENAVEKVCEIASGLKSDNSEAAESLMEALVLSGLAIQLCGSSRPASGAEHHLSHLWEMDFITRGKPAELHGKKVGIAEVIVSDIYKKATALGDIRNKKINKDHPVNRSVIQNVFGKLSEDILRENTPDPLCEVKENSLEKYWNDI